MAKNDVENLLTKPGSGRKRRKKPQPSRRNSKKPSVEANSETPSTPKTVPAQPVPATPTDEELLAAQEVIFEPNEGPQTDFLSASEQEVLYGGSAGGGKSYAMLADPLRDMDDSNFRGIIFRRTNDELRELKDTSKLLYPKVFGDKMRWHERDSRWITPRGGTFWMTYLDKDDDVLRYQGQAFTWIGFDELTQWPTPHAWDYMRSRLRSAHGIKMYQRATSNPGGPGHQWVKKTFIDPAPPNRPFWATDIETGKTMVWPKNSQFAIDNDLVGKPMLKRRFIPASLFDNPYLAKDGLYEANLLSLPEHQRKQLLEGDWDVAEGAAFPEFNRTIHTVEPFDIPRSWKKFRACDYGYGSHSAVIWFAVEPKTDVLIIYRELYVSKVTATDLADMIADIERGEGRVSYGVLDSSLWHNRGDVGPSLAEKMNRKGMRFRPSDRSKGSRVAGKNEIHRLLQIDKFTGKPGLQIFNNCTETIAQLPAIPLDKRNPEDVDTNYPHDHIYDAIRYGVMSRPRSHIFDDIPEDSYKPASSTFGY